MEFGIRQIFPILLFLLQDICHSVGAGYYLNSLGYPVFHGQESGKSSSSEETNFQAFASRNNNLPTFDFSLPQNITTIKDANAYLHCIVKNIGNRTVSWIREDNLHILTVDKYTYTADNRFEVIHKPNTESWILKVNSVQPRDAGRYECQVNTHPTDPISFPVWLNVFVPTAVILGTAERYVDRGSTINLTCIIEHHPQPKVENFWYHNNRMINYDSRESLVSVITDRGPTTKTILLIHDASDAATGMYSCVPSPSTAVSIKIHILNGETPAAMQTNSCSSLESCLLNLDHLSYWLSILITILQIQYFI